MRSVRIAVLCDRTLDRPPCNRASCGRSIGRSGAVVVVVRDGETLSSTGYGFADLDKEVPVDVHHRVSAGVLGGCVFGAAVRHTSHTAMAGASRRALSETVGSSARGV